MIDQKFLFEQGRTEEDGERDRRKPRKEEEKSIRIWEKRSLQIMWPIEGSRKRSITDGRGYLQKTTDMSLPLVNHISSGFAICSPRRREVCFHTMIDKLDAFLCYYSFLLLSLSHRVLSSYPNFSVIFLFIQRLHAKRFGGMGVNVEATFRWLSIKRFL